MGNADSTIKKATNVSAHSNLPADARELKINLSAERWKRENRDAIKAYNQFIAEHGVWSDEFRTW
jgi:antitoxin CcdA